MSLVRVCVTAVIWLVLSVSIAIACSCVDRAFEEKFRSADLVFEGLSLRTQSIESGEQEAQSGPYFILSVENDQTTTFKVTRAIKGTGFETRQIRHYLDGGSCGIGFEAGSTYRVYARRWRGKFYTDLCTGTKSLEPRRFRPKDLPDPAKSTWDVLKQIRDPKLPELHALKLLREYEEREEEKETEFFIRRYIEKAEAAAGQAKERRVSGYSGALAAAKFYESWGDYERAAEMYKLVARVAPLDAHGPAEAGRVLYLADHAKQAIPFLQSALRLDTDYREAEIFLARARLKEQSILTRGVSDYRAINLQTAVLDRARHPGIDLTGAVISELSARSARLPGAKFTNATFGKANFQEANLTAAFLVAAEVNGGNFTRAILRNVYGLDANFYGAKFTGADLSNVQGSQAQFDLADLRGARLGNANFEGSDFRKARMDGVRLRSTNLSKANFRSVSLLGTDLRGALINGTDFLGARIDCKTKLPDKVNIRNDGLIPVPATCNGTEQNRDFSSRDWKNTDFSGLDLQGASFAQTEFSPRYADDYSFIGANLQNTDFTGASGDARFSAADLTGANFTHAEIEGVFHGSAAGDGHPEAQRPAVLRGTRFTGAKLETEAFIGRLHTRLPFERPDYQVALFDNARIECSLGNQAEDIERMAREPAKSRDLPKLIGPFWEELSEGERQKVREQAEAWRLREEEARKQNATFIQAEREMVLFLREKWPSVTFDESCQYYLAAPDANPEN